MRYRITAGVALLAALLLGLASASATAEQSRSAGSAQASPNDTDVEFVEMMIPHHFQALLMSDMAPERSDDDRLVRLANRIDVEQGVEITSMRGWQQRNGLEVTDPEQAYEELLQDPEMLEHMGMATPEEMDELSASEGDAFDVLYLELMITHHEGAVHMLNHVIAHGSDLELQQMAGDMLTTQNTQLRQMEAMLENKTS